MGWQPVDEMPPWALNYIANLAIEEEAPTGDIYSIGFHQAGGRSFHIAPNPSCTMLEILKASLVMGKVEPATQVSHAILKGEMGVRHDNE